MSKLGTHDTVPLMPILQISSPAQHRNLAPVVTRLPPIAVLTVAILCAMTTTLSKIVFTGRHSIISAHGYQWPGNTTSPMERGLYVRAVRQSCKRKMPANMRKIDACS